MANTTCIRNPAGQWTSAIAEMVLVDSPVLILVPSTTWKLENEDKAFRNQAGSSQTKENSYQLEFSLISSMKRPAELQIHNSELKTWAAPCCLLTHHTGKLSFSTANSCSNLKSMSKQVLMWRLHSFWQPIKGYHFKVLRRGNSIKFPLWPFADDEGHFLSLWLLQLHAVKPGTTLAEQQWGKKQKRGQTQDATQDLFLPLLLQVMKTQ